MYAWSPNDCTLPFFSTIYASKLMSYNSTLPGKNSISWHEQGRIPVVTFFVITHQAWQALRQQWCCSIILCCLEYTLNQKVFTTNFQKTTSNYERRGTVFKKTCRWVIKLHLYEINIYLKPIGNNTCLKLIT